MPHHPFLALITPLSQPGGGETPPSPPLGIWGGRPPNYVDIGGPGPQPHPEHPIVIPPNAIAPGVPTHPIYIPVYPSHPIVIPPGAISPGVPTHPIVLPPGTPTHPIVIPPGAVAPGVPTHPIYLPPYVDIGFPGNQPYPDQGLPGNQPYPDQGLPKPTPPLEIWPSPGHPAHPIVIPPPPDTAPLPPVEGGKPPPADGGWGYHPEYGWGYFPPGGKPMPSPGSLKR